MGRLDPELYGGPARPSDYVVTALTLGSIPWGARGSAVRPVVAEMDGLIIGGRSSARFVEPLVPEVSEVRALTQSHPDFIGPREFIGPLVREQIGAADTAAPDLVAGSSLHKATRWTEYQANGGAWNFDRWSNVYDANMTRASAANEAVDAYHQTLGWGRREVTVNTNIDGVDYARRLDIGDISAQRGVEYKTGYQSATQENLWEVSRDGHLVQNGWDIHWEFRNYASQPLQKALTDAGIKFKVGKP